SHRIRFRPGNRCRLFRRTGAPAAFSHKGLPIFRRNCCDWQARAGIPNRSSISEKPLSGGNPDKNLRKNPVRPWIGRRWGVALRRLSGPWRVGRMILLDERLLIDAQAVEQINSSSLRLVVDPLFDVALVIHLPGLLGRRAEEVTHLLGLH